MYAVLNSCKGAIALVMGKRFVSNVFEITTVSRKPSKYVRFRLESMSWANQFRYGNFSRPVSLENCLDAPHGCV